MYSINQLFLTMNHNHNTIYDCFKSVRERERERERERMLCMGSMNTSLYKWFLYETDVWTFPGFSKNLFFKYLN